MSNRPLLSGYFDCVIMLTWSDWRTEPRSNRYHYASRFAKHVPVFFVQPDLPDKPSQLRLVEEDTELHNVKLWRMSRGVIVQNRLRQKSLISEALHRHGCRRPLVWAYNTSFEPLIGGMYGAFKVYHATEDYFSTDEFKYPEEFREGLRSTLQRTDLLVAVSDGVAESYRTRGGYEGEALVLQNGVDYGFYSKKPEGAELSEQPVALFQGGINKRLDYPMIHEVVRKLPDWEFRFCGPEDVSIEEWHRIKEEPNVTYLGFLDADGIRAECYRAHVGIIPYAQTPNVVERSLPIKAFEYVACGLPVVTVPVNALEPFHVFEFAKNADEFAAAIKKVAPARTDAQALDERDFAARSMDYDRRFEKLTEVLEKRVAEGEGKKRNVLVLYDDGSTHVSTIREHLAGFGKYSRHEVYYAPATNRTPCPYDLDLFDVIVIHYSIRLSLREHLSPEYADRIAESRALKVLFIQDEYDTPAIAREWIHRLKLDIVYTCVPEPGRELVYPTSEFPNVHFVETLTGYVPESYSKIEPVRPPSEREYLIGYRGRDLPYWYGDLGQEKLQIGIRMREECDKRNLPVNIEWTSEHRIYGPGWYEFVQSCRTMLGTESGANVFDDTGGIRAAIEKALKENPNLSYAEARERFLAEHEGNIVQNQISPKIFEAVAFRTGLVLYEGKYSGVVRPNEHFIPLKKDWSNIEEVLEKVKDDKLIEEMTERAYRDVIGSEAYTYERFVEGFDEVISEIPLPVPARELVTGVVAIVEKKKLESFIFYSPSRYLASREILEGKKLDDPFEIEAAPIIRQDVAAILKRVRVRTLFRFMLRNLFMRLPPQVRKPLEAPIKALLQARKKRLAAAKQKVVT